MRMAKNIIQSLATHLGVRIVRDLGRDPRSDIRKFMRPTSAPVIFDVGANRGQSVRFFKARFPQSVIHSFEASPTTFRALQENCLSESNVYCWNYALGATRGKQLFLENSNSDMSSFLELSQFGWGKIEGEIWLDLETIDGFCSTRNIEYIDVLKSDTQGYELEVFRGAESLMKQNKIGLLYFELIFSDMYKNLPGVHDIFKFLTDRGFVFVSFYSMHYQRNLASWTDALFAHESLIDTNAETTG